VTDPRPIVFDQNSLDRLSRRNRSALIKYFSRRGFNREDAEDAVQEVFMRLARREQGSQIDNVEGYLFETAYHVAIDHFRRGVSRNVTRHDNYDQNIDIIDKNNSICPERMHEARDELARLIFALRDLPERTRDVLILSRLEGLTHREIARRLGVSVSSVEKHVIKAISHLSYCLGRGRV
jgi:RNA polymerase sigma factor (sigma-70 family)